MDKTPKPLYRKHNKLAANFHLNSPGGEFRHERNTKAIKNFVGYRQKIKQTKEGYDYTPLYKFLLSKVGQKWDEVFSEIIPRLDKTDPIFYMVCLDYKENDEGFVRIGDTSYYSKLTVIGDLLRLAKPNTTPPAPTCNCCTYTFNGKPY